MDFSNFPKLVNSIILLANPILAVLTAIALVYFFIGVYRYVASAGDTAAKFKGRTMLVWGIIALVVLTSFWGIVGVLVNTLNGASGGDFSTTNTTFSATSGSASSDCNVVLFGNCL